MGADIDAEGSGASGNPLRTAWLLGHNRIDRGANENTERRFGASYSDCRKLDILMGKYYETMDSIFGKDEIRDLIIEREWDWGVTAVCLIS